MRYDRLCGLLSFTKSMGPNRYSFLLQAAEILLIDPLCLVHYCNCSRYWWGHTTIIWNQVILIMCVSQGSTASGGEEPKILSFQNSGQKYHFSSFDHGESTHIGLSSFLFIWRIFCQKIWSWNNVQRIGVCPRWNNWELKFFPSYSSPTGCLTVIGPVKPLKVKLKFLWEWLFVCIDLFNFYSTSSNFYKSQFYCLSIYDNAY